MAYTALYNKYRPRTFEQVAGQHAIVRTLRNAINNGKIAHAYLFCGPRGTGKTSMARLFAKALNCDEGIGHQCNECVNCRQLNDNSHPDVIEIDAASNNGVDQVRDLIDQVRYAPIQGRTKVYIIDEVHMMSAEAFNALLKTLEEPPNHVVFILATTEPHKVLATILSRCQRFDFEKISHSDMKEKLSWILKQEEVSYEENALEEIIELADGGMRDSLSLLDQALAYGGNELLEKDVLSVFGLASTKEKIALLRMITTGEVGEVLDKLNQFLDSGLDIKRLSASLLDVLKDEVIYRRTGKVTYAKSLTLEEAEELSHYVDTERANKMINVLLKAQVDFKNVSNIRSLFELTLLQMTTLFGEDKQDIIVTPVTPYEKPKVTAPAPAPIKEEPVKQEAKVEPKEEPKEEIHIEEKQPEPVVEQPKPEAKEEETVPETKVSEPMVEKPKQTFTRRDYDPFTDGTYTGATPPSFLFTDAENGAKPANNIEFPPKEEKKAPIEKTVQKEPVPPVEEKTVEVMQKPVEPAKPVESVKHEEEAKPIEGPRLEPKKAEETKIEPAPVSEPKPTAAPSPAPKPEPEPEPLPTIDTSMIFNATVAAVGTPLTLNDDTIVNIMVLGSQFKEKRKTLVQKWSVFSTLSFDPKIGQAATLLSKGRPFCLCDDALLINFSYSDQAERCNLKENQRILRQLVGQLFGKEVFVYGLDRNASNRCQQVYFSKLAVRELPLPEEVNLVLPK